MKLTPEQVAAFHRDGLLIAPNVLTDADLQPVIDDISAIIDERAKRYKAEGKIQDTFDGEPFETRLARLTKQYPLIASNIDIMQTMREPMFRFLLNDNLLDAVESLVGGEIICNPIQHLRAKMPLYVQPKADGYLDGVPWHQDVAVTWEEADVSDIITCWIPLVDATLERGCMEVMPGIVDRGYIEHQKEGGTTIRPDLFPNEVKTKTAECPKGGVVFMSQYTPHKGLPNESEVVRWSLDLRYQKTGTPTGRPFWPDFVVRSRSNPASVQDSYQQWCDRWAKALEQSKGIAWHRTVPKEQRIPEGMTLAKV